MEGQANLSRIIKKCNVTLYKVMIVKIHFVNERIPELCGVGLAEDDGEGVLLLLSFHQLDLQNTHLSNNTARIIECLYTISD